MSYLYATAASKVPVAAWAESKVNMNGDCHVTKAELVAAIKRRYIFEGLEPATQRANRVWSALGFSGQDSVRAQTFHAAAVGYTGANQEVADLIIALGRAGKSDSRISVGALGKGTGLRAKYLAPTYLQNDSRD